MIKPYKEQFRFIEPEDCSDCEKGMEVLDLFFKDIQEEPDYWELEDKLRGMLYDTGYGFYFTYNKNTKELLITLENHCEE